tara:strand:+ start:11255 stop:21055 length:9801 start_codon:yes stop_codon:yes gene_type:complete
MANGNLNYTFNDQPIPFESLEEAAKKNGMSVEEYIQAINKQEGSEVFKIQTPVIEDDILSDQITEFGDTIDPWAGPVPLGVDDSEEYRKEQAKISDFDFNKVQGSAYEMTKEVKDASESFWNQSISKFEEFKPDNLGDIAGKGFMKEEFFSGPRHDYINGVIKKYEKAYNDNSNIEVAQDTDFLGKLTGLKVTAENGNVKRFTHSQIKLDGSFETEINEFLKLNQDLNKRAKHVEQLGPINNTIDDHIENWEAHLPVKQEAKYDDLGRLISEETRYSANSFQEAMNIEDFQNNLWTAIKEDARNQGIDKETFSNYSIEKFIKKAQHKKVVDDLKAENLENVKEAANYIQEEFNGDISIFRNTMDKSRIDNLSDEEKVVALHWNAWRKSNNALKELVKQYDDNPSEDLMNQIKEAKKEADKLYDTATVALSTYKGEAIATMEGTVDLPEGLGGGTMDAEVIEAETALLMDFFKNENNEKILAYNDVLNAQNALREKDKYENKFDVKIDPDEYIPIKPGRGTPDPNRFKYGYASNYAIELVKIYESYPKGKEPFKWVPSTIEEGLASETAGSVRQSILVTPNTQVPEDVKTYKKNGLTYYDKITPASELDPTKGMPSQQATSGESGVVYTKQSGRVNEAILQKKYAFGEFKGIPEWAMIQVYGKFNSVFTPEEGEEPDFAGYNKVSPHGENDYQNMNEHFTSLWLEDRSLYAKTKAMDQLYYMNIDPVSMEKSGFWGEFGDALAESVSLNVDTKNELLQAVQTISTDEMGIDPETGEASGVYWSEEHRDHFEQTTGEFTGQILGGIPIMAAEFAALNIATAGMLSATGVTEARLAWRIGTLVDKTGKAIKKSSDTYKLAKAIMSGGITVGNNVYKGSKGLKLWMQANNIKKAHRFKDIAKRGTDIALTIAIEEGKMQFIGLPTGAGAGFAIVGGAFGGIVNRMGLKFTGELAGLNAVGKLGQAGISMGIAAEAAPHLEAYIDHIIEHKDYKTFLDENYSDLDTVERRVAGNVLTGFGFGVTKLKLADFAVTMKSKKWLSERLADKIALEKAKGKDKSNKLKIKAYESLHRETNRQINEAYNWWMEVSPEARIAEVNRRMTRLSRSYNLETGKELNWETATGNQLKKLGYEYKLIKKGENGYEEGKKNKHWVGGSPAKFFDTFKTKDGKLKKDVLLIDPTKISPGVIPHEMGHKAVKDFGLNSAIAMGKLRDALEPAINKSLNRRILKKYTDKGLTYKEAVKRAKNEGEYLSLKEIIKDNYVDQDKMTRPEEYLGNVIEFLQTPGVGKELLKDNHFEPVSQGLKSWYERMLKQTPLDGQKIHIRDPQQLIDMLYRLSGSFGKKGYSKQMKALQNTVFEGKRLIDWANDKVIGQNGKDAAGLAIEFANKIKAQTTTKAKLMEKDKRLFQSTDQVYLMNKAQWTDEARKKRLAAQIISQAGEIGPEGKSAWEMNIISRLKNLNVDNTTKELIASQFVYGKRGLIDLISKFDPNKMKNPETGKPYESISAYLNSKPIPGNRSRDLIDVRLQEYYEKELGYGTIKKRLSDPDVQRETDIIETNRSLSLEDRAKSDTPKERLIDPLNLRGLDKTKVAEKIYENIEKIFLEEKFSFKELSDLAPEAIAEMFGIRPKLLKDYYEGKTKYIHDLTYSDKVFRINKDTGKKEIFTEKQAINKGLKIGVDVFREASEVSNTQQTLNINGREILSMLPPFNIVPRTSKDKKDVSPELKGTALGIKGKLLNLLYESYTDPKAFSKDKAIREDAITTKTGRSKTPAGTAVKRLKPEFREITKESLQKFKEIFGITEAKKPNEYSKNIHGPVLKQGIILTGSLITNKALRNYLEPHKKAFIQEIADTAAGLSKSTASWNLSQKARNHLFSKVRNENFDMSKKGLKSLLESEEMTKMNDGKPINSITKNHLFQIIGGSIVSEKALREAAKVIYLKEAAEAEGRPAKDIALDHLKGEKNWKGQMPKLSKLYGVDLKYRSHEEAFQTEHWTKNLRQKFGGIFKEYYYDGMPIEQLRSLLTTVGYGKLKVKHDDGTIRRITLGSGSINKNRLDKFTKEELHKFVKEVWDVDISKNTKRKHNVAGSQPEWGTKGIKKKHNELIERVEKGEISEAEMTKEFEAYVTNGKGWERYAQDNRSLLASVYNKLYTDVYNAYKTKDKNKLKTEIELVNEFLAAQTSIGNGWIKGLVPVIGYTLKPSRGTQTPGKKQNPLTHNEHSPELFQTTAVKFQDIMSRMKTLKSTKAKKEIEKMVNGLFQILTSYESKQIKDSKEMGGQAGQISPEPLLNTLFRKSQGENVILFGEFKGNANEVLFEKYGKKILLDAIKNLPESELSTTAVRTKLYAENSSSRERVKKYNSKILESRGISSKNLSNSGIIEQIKNLDRALELAREKNKKPKGISILDFDDTVATSKSKVIVNMPYYAPGKTTEAQMRITPAEFAKRHRELEEMGAAFDFSEFNKVVDGKKGPLFNKLQKAVNKFGNENVFILTARPQESATAIQVFLEGMGVKLKIENITGLEDGRPIAKAQFVVNKAAEGYNDFYFADDIMANVKAVKRVLDIVDVKSNVQQALAAKNLSKDINAMIEYSTGIGKEKTYSAAKAGLAGKSKWEQSLYMPARAGDFHSLSNALLGKGIKGLENRKWFEENIIKPFSRGDLAYNTERRTKLADYYALRRGLKDVKSFRDMFKKNPLHDAIEKGEVWTNQHAIRVYNWAKQGTLPKDISKTDVKKLVKHVNNNPKLKAFAEELVSLHKGEGYPEPREMWLSETITQDILLGGKKTSRDKHFKEFIENVDIVFSEQNLNKMEAAFGKPWRTAMENNLEAMKTGTNRPSWGRGNKWESDFLDWVNGSIGSTMFINMRSALLQQVSIPNYINVTDNNIFAASKAFATSFTPKGEFRKTYLELMNDPWSKNRRDGLRYNVQESEIAELFATTKNKPAALVNWALKKGFILTKFMDSHATAFGGASFVINRTKTYEKQVNPETGKKYTYEEAREKAKVEWREMSDATQQTSRMDRVSPEQRSVSGRLVLPFSQVQMLYGRRYTDDAARDLINKRYDHLYKGENSALKKIGQIIYGTTVSAAVFHGLQQAIFKVIFDDGNTLDGEELEVANSTLDGILVGSGIVGKALAVFKNWMLKMDKESKKKNPQYANTATEFLKISPPIDKKYRQFKSALSGLQYNMDDIGELSLDNPALTATTKIIEATTNAPIDNLLINMQNVEAALEEDRANWQRPFLIGGWPAWQLEDNKKESEKKSKKKKQEVPAYLWD